MKKFYSNNFVLLLLCFLHITSCKSIKDERVQVDYIPKIYLLSSGSDKSVLLYLKNYKTGKIEQKYSGERTINLSNGDLIKFKPYVSMLPLRNEIEITEFSVIYLNYKIDEKIFFNFNGNSIIFDKIIKSDDGYLLIPNTMQNIDSYEFGVYTIKVDTNSLKRYFPSSERLRIELLDNKTKFIWNSNYNQNYLAVVGEFNTKEVGEINYFKILWNKKDNNKNKIKPNEYLVNFILPLQPKNMKIMKTIYLE